MRIDYFLRLSTSVTDLRPKLVTVAGTLSSPLPKQSLSLSLECLINDHVPGALQMISVN